MEIKMAIRLKEVKRMKSFYVFVLGILVFMSSCEKWDLERKPDIETMDAKQISAISAVAGGKITIYTNDPIIKRGVCWSQNLMPDISDSASYSGNGAGNFDCNVSGLLVNTQYYYRAWAETNFGIVYGPQKTFTTLVGGPLPIISTAIPSEITQNSATSGGTVSYDGGSALIQRGVCWSNALSPTIADDTLVSGKGEGSYISRLENLNMNTTYYIRAFAINANGTYYGNEISFNTLTGSGTLPSVSTSTIAAITQTTAIGGGNVLFSGGFNVSKRGICWSTNPNPTINETFSIDGNGMGVFSSILYGLIPNTQYYVRSYATNATGTSYGNQVTFTTQSPITSPAITTIAASNVTLDAALSGGIISSGGGATVSARGVCWSTQQHPTTTDNFTTDGSGTGTFTSQLSGLQPSTQYYLRAYATNAAGTAYGNEISFSTMAGSIYSIGQSFGGGVIFYIDSTAQHGLIAAPFDQLSGVSWGCYGINISGAAGTAIGAGSNNTQFIMNDCSENDFAASICFNLQLNGFNDWYLPSKDELNLLFLQRFVVGNFQNSFYWSSSQNSAIEAWEQNFFSGLQLTYGKYDPISVRAIRSF